MQNLIAPRTHFFKLKLHAHLLLTPAFNLPLFAFSIFLRGPPPRPVECKAYSTGVSVSAFSFSSRIGYAGW